MDDLSVADFHAFFLAVHGYAPFPWQNELAQQVVTTSRWPSLLDLPTGTGKTAVIDIAVFHLAMDALKCTARSAPLRMFFVIDRRIVVDEAFSRANRIASALRCPAHPILKKIAERLACLSGKSESPLDVVRLRGGMPQERDWARSPAQPLVAVSTVDQLGSRLLFRGYGVSNRMSPVHAGLVGADALWLLDEVHLSQPFEQTLAAIDNGHASSEQPGLLSQTPRLAPFRVVKLSATPGAVRPTDVFPGEFDIRKDAPEIFLQRLSASKITELIGTGDNPASDFANQATRLLRETSPMATKPSRSRSKNQSPAMGLQIAPVRRMAVVVNRVAFARQVFDKLSKAVGEIADVLLLTGRIRPLDRERIIGRLDSLFSGMDRPAPEKPIIVVATQTIEAGADFDVDALITEIAPLDCLRQRFGRLDRLGLRGTSRAVILYPAGKPVPKSDKAGLKTCPWRRLERIYGEAPFETWKWLAKIKGMVDFGVDAMDQKLTEKAGNIEKMLAPRASAPYLLPPYAGLWSTTSPYPSATPEPSLFLHGPGNLPEVRVVWRSDVQPTNNSSTVVPASLALCPPASSEALSLPIWAIQRWLSQDIAEFKEHRSSHFDLADIPQAESVDRLNGEDTGRLVLRTDGERWNWITARDIRPDDLLVVPTIFGGCDEWGWNPDWLGEVLDYGFEAHYYQRLKCALRISASTLNNAWQQTLSSKHDISATEEWRSIAAWLQDAGDDLSPEAIAHFVQQRDVLPETWRTVLAACAAKRMTIRWMNDDEHSAGFVLSCATLLPDNLLGAWTEKEAEGAPALTGLRESSGTGVSVTLADHSSHVELLVADYCSRSGIANSLKILLLLAARLHDIGKAEPRFQVDLHGAGALAWLDPLLAMMLNPGKELLAKSARLAEGSSNSRRATPKFFRHEALSVALAKQHPSVMALAPDDQDLVLWLIGTHHGHGRPFFPPCAELSSDNMTTLTFDAVQMSSYAQDSPIRLDQGWFELAKRVQRRFGPWELARLEAIMRLADHTASAEEQTYNCANAEVPHD